MRPPVKGTQDVPIKITVHLVARVTDEAATTLPSGQLMARCGQQFLALLATAPWIADTLAILVEETAPKMASDKDQ